MPATVSQKGKGMMRSLCIGILIFCAIWDGQSQSAPSPLSLPCLPNAFQVTTNVFSGATPVGTNAFAELKRLGVKTIITVDGARPDAEAAAAHGLRYVHLPIGYGAMSRDQELSLIKAASTLPGPFYLHCHHGKHRGPTAAALVCMASEGWNGEQALSWMRTAGTGTNYTGLFQTIQKLNLPSIEELSALSTNFPAQAEPTPLVDAMVAIDRHFDHLAFIKKGNPTKEAASTNPEAQHEATLLEEAFRELLRSPAIKGHPAPFKMMLTESEASAAELRLLLAKSSATPEHWDRVEGVYKSLNKACTACHNEYRD